MSDTTFRGITLQPSIMFLEASFDDHNMFIVQAIDLLKFVHDLASIKAQSLW